MTGWKLFRVRKDGTLGSLFIDRQRPLAVGQWMRAKRVRTNGYAYRPGWHVLLKRSAPHLSTRGRVWRRVTARHILGVHERPRAQGGTWVTCRDLRIDA